MVNLIWITLLFSLSAFAQSPTREELLQETLERLYPDGIHRNTKAFFKDIEKKWKKFADGRNLSEDHNQDRINWNKLFPIKKSRLHKIRGKRTYFNLFPKFYNYDILEDSKANTLVVKVRVHITPTQKYINKSNKLKAEGSKDFEKYPLGKELKIKLQEAFVHANTIWNDKAPRGVKIQIDLVDTAEKAHYSVKLGNYRGSLYDKFFSVPVNPSTLAHEAGHMMGLDDEYSMAASIKENVHSLAEDFGLRKKSTKDLDYQIYEDRQCYIESLMCDGKRTFSYFYKHILGRIRN